jgi:hypothetical protein
VFGQFDGDALLVLPRLEKYRAARTCQSPGGIIRKWGVIHITTRTIRRYDHLPMNELFWQAGTLHLPLAEQEFFELALMDPPNIWGDTYIVRRTRFEWNLAEMRMLPADHIIDRVQTLEMATARYELHRKLLAEQGFFYSDMDQFSEPE